MKIFNLLQLFREEVNIFVGEVKRKSIGLLLVQNSLVPPIVFGDQRRVRKAISSVIANAIQNTSIGAVKLEVYLAENADDHVDIDVVIQDTGVGMSAEMFDLMFRDLEQIKSEYDERLMDKTEPPRAGTVERGCFLQPRKRCYHRGIEQSTSTCQTGFNGNILCCNGLQ